MTAAITKKKQDKKVIERCDKTVGGLFITGKHNGFKDAPISRFSYARKLHQQIPPYFSK